MADWQEVGERVVQLAARLVATASVVDTDGEGELAELLESYLRAQAQALPFVEISSVRVEKPTDCRAVLAYLPAASRTPKTLLLMGHFDTVGVEPYGSLQGIAFDSEALKRHFAERGSEELAAAAGSEDWAFGRGWLDMKGAIAAVVEVFLEHARSRELPANLVLLLTPDEESASRGVRALIPELLKLRERDGLEFTHVVNADYTAPLGAGDQNRYFFSGVTGKLLVGISVFGRPAHAGETFSGVNASALAGFLASGLEHNHKLLAGAGGEWLPPPTVLRVADRRRRYDVMTADCAELYFNMFHVGREPAKRWHALLSEVRRLVKLFDRERRRRYNRFAAKADRLPERYPLKPEVIDYAQLAAGLADRQIDPAAVLASLRESAREYSPDGREQAFHVIRGLYQQRSFERPVVVVSLLPPFYPARLADGADPGTKVLIELAAECGLKHRRIYPYVSDMSYFCFATHAGLETWERQSPLWFAPEELVQYQEVATRVCNIGPWGIGAHTTEERVYLPYLRDVLPWLLAEALQRLARAAQGA